MRFRVDLAYDGGPFAGFARQAGQRTVQGDLEEALCRLFRQPITTSCAGRTDRGVHACAQVVHFDADEADAARIGPLPTVAARIDHMLGDEVTIWQLSAVSSGFDARFSATARLYCYRIVDGPAATYPLSRHDRWRVDERLSVGAMRLAARPLIGEHDFASLCRRAPGRTTVRRLDKITIRRPTSDRIDVRLRGGAFCHQQVRSIVGCLVEVGRGVRNPEWIAEVLAARDRSVAARVAPPHGLTLEGVQYGRSWPAAPPVSVRAVLDR